MLGREPHARRPRFKLTGLESPEELWDRLRDSEAEVESLAACNAQLEAELDATRRRLGGAGELTDDELMAELPQRMTRNLAAAQDVADEMVERAQNDAMIIRLNADQVVAQMVAAAKAEADRIVRGTIAESQAHVAAARARGNELLRAAHAERSQILADLEDRRSRAAVEHQSLDEHRHRLEQAYEQVAVALADARAALAAGADQSPPVSVEHPRRTERAERAERADRADRADRSERAGGTEPTLPSPSIGERASRTTEAGDRAAANGERAAADATHGPRVGDGRRAAVFDWSRSTGARAPARPASDPAPGGDASYGVTDAAAV